jgi:hypothetical protein
VRIGVTGHVLLADGTAVLVYRCLTEALRPHADGGLHGVTCLANGADQLFARAVDALDGTFEVVLPATDYRRVALTSRDRKRFDRLLRRAATISYMPFDTSGPDAYLAASEEMLRRVDALFAVWDGKPSEVAGSTADVVRRAEERGVPVTVFWPDGAARA